MWTFIDGSLEFPYNNIGGVRIFSLLMPPESLIMNWGALYRVQSHRLCIILKRSLTIERYMHINTLIVFTIVQRVGRAGKAQAQQSNEQHSASHIHSPKFYSTI